LPVGNTGDDIEDEIVQEIRVHGFVGSFADFYFRQLKK